MQALSYWISISIYHDQLDKVIHDVVIPLRESLRENNLASKLIFTRSAEGGENVVLICEVRKQADGDAINNLVEEKARAFFEVCPAPEKKIELPINYWFLPFPNNHVHYKEYFLFDIMEAGGLQASRFGEDLLEKSSDLTLDFIASTGDDWNVDSALGIAIQFHLAFVLAFDKDLENLSLFYNSFFQHFLAKVEDDDDNPAFKKNLIEGLETNFEEQKEALADFTQYIANTILENSSFDDNWLNEWFEFSSRFAEQIKTLQSKGEFYPPEEFKLNDEVKTPVAQQELWSILEYYQRALNAQLGISNAYEINLLYSLRECTKLLAARTEA